MQANILAVGDVVGAGGVNFITKKLRQVKKDVGAHFTVVNGENAAGVGFTVHQAEDIFAAGADVITMGNHTFDRAGVENYLDDCRYILRPANLAPHLPGRGWGVFDASFGQVMVINLIGRCGMDFGPDNPFTEVDRILKKEHPPVVLLDFHAEATSEKLAMARHLDGRASCVWGTHTHVQTSDAGVLPGGTGHITDLGMTGPVDSILGVRPEQSVEMFLGSPKQKFETASGPQKLECAVFTVDTDTGRCISARALRIVEGGA